mgnify:CR=1 FL=1
MGGAWGEAARLPKPQSWACFYGAHLSSAAWRSLELIIADPDNLRAPSEAGPLRLAYVSAGEADERRWFWPQVQGKDYLIEPNPDWAGAHRVDLRSPDWRALLISTVIPAALARGWQGVMLDTLDTAEYFESSAPARFPGSIEAAAGFVRDLRAAHPEIIIVVNNAFPVLERAEEAIDGVLVEDLYTRCAPDKACVRPPKDEARRREEYMKKFKARTGKPVLVIIYAQPGEMKSRLVADSVKRARKAGFSPYVGGPTLERLGLVRP